MTKKRNREYFKNKKLYPFRWKGFTHVRDGEHTFNIKKSNVWDDLLLGKPRIFAKKRKLRLVEGKNYFILYSSTGLKDENGNTVFFTGVIPNLPDYVAK